jgi:hypothetical protein
MVLTVNIGIIAVSVVLLPVAAESYSSVFAISPPLQVLLPYLQQVIFLCRVKELVCLYKFFLLCRF